MIAHIAGSDTVVFAALASLPFALSILFTRWVNSEREQSRRRFNKIARIANEVDREVSYALSRERHPAGRDFRKN